MKFHHLQLNLELCHLQIIKFRVGSYKENFPNVKNVIVVNNPIHKKQTAKLNKTLKLVDCKLQSTFFTEDN